MENIKVLIVEDEIDIRETISEILLDEGFEVIQAENGKMGYKMFEQHNPDIVISDIMMPEVDGYQLLNLVRKSRTKNNLVPFIFLTALAQKENIIKGTELTANDYLVKPIDFEILIAKIKEKTLNALKIKKNHEYGINNIKSQIAQALPNELNHNIDSMMMNCENLINEPYGPFPHRRYKEELTRMMQSLKRLKSSIHNYLNEQVINNKLNPNEEVICVTNFFQSSIEKLPENLASRIIFHEPFDMENFPKLKMDKFLLVAIFKTVIAATLKCGHDSTIEISTILDNEERVVVIFYINGQINTEVFTNYVKSRKIDEDATLQGCQFDINFNEKGNNVTFTIPSFRILK